MTSAVINGINVELTAAEEAEFMARQTPSAEQISAAESRRIAALWQAAHDYEVAQISGSAIGLLTIGVLQSKPKCLAVQAWIKSIWMLYYERKAGGSTERSFTVCGSCPHSVPELMVELGV